MKRFVLALVLTVFLAWCWKINQELQNEWDAKRDRRESWFDDVISEINNAIETDDYLDYDEFASIHKKSMDMFSEMGDLLDKSEHENVDLSWYERIDKKSEVILDFLDLQWRLLEVMQEISDSRKEHLQIDEDIDNWLPYKELEDKRVNTLVWGMKVDIDLMDLEPLIEWKIDDYANTEYEDWFNYLYDVGAVASDILKEYNDEYDLIYDKLEKTYSSDPEWNTGRYGKDNLKNPEVVEEVLNRLEENDE